MSCSFPVTVCDSACAHASFVLTRRKEHDGLEAGVLGRVDLQGLQLLHLLLEDTDVVHEGHHALRRHGRGVQAGRCQQRGHMKRHGALGRVEDKELAPRHAQQRHLRHRQHGVVTGGGWRKACLNLKMYTQYRSRLRHISFTPGANMSHTAI